MSEFFQPGQHPDADQLSAFAERALPAHEQQQMLAHLAQCAACRSIAYLAAEAAIEEQAAPDAASAPSASARNPWFAKWFTGWNLAWPAGAAVACLVIAAVQLHLFSARKDGGVPTTVAANLPPAKIAPLAPQATPEQQPIAPRGNALPGPVTRSPERPKVDVASEPVTTTISSQIVDSATLTGRNASELARMEPPPAAVAGKSTESERPAAAMNKLAAPPSAKSVTVAASGNEAEMPVDTAGVSVTLNGVLVDSPAPSQRAASLPSHQPVASRVSNGRVTLAIDSAGALFVSKDGGKHWKAVSARWTGRAVKVEFASASRQPSPVAGVFAHPIEEKAVPAAAKAKSAPSETPHPVPQISNAAGPGTLSGVVTDQTSAVIPYATLVLTNTSSGGARTVQSDSQGRYLFNGLPAAGYSLKVTSRGFETWMQNVIKITASQGASINIQLKIGAEAETIAVTTNASEIQTDSNPVAASINEDQLSESRAVFQLTTETGIVWTSSDGHHWKRK